MVNRIAAIMECDKYKFSYNILHYKSLSEIKIFLKSIGESLPKVFYSDYENIMNALIIDQHKYLKVFVDFYSMLTKAGNENSDLNNHYLTLLDSVIEIILEHKYNCTGIELFTVIKEVSSLVLYKDSSHAKTIFLCLRVIQVTGSYCRKNIIKNLVLVTNQNLDLDLNNEFELVCNFTNYELNFFKQPLFLRSHNKIPKLSCIRKIINNKSLYDFLNFLADKVCYDDYINYEVLDYDYNYNNLLALFIKIFFKLEKNILLFSNFIYKIKEQNYNYFEAKAFYNHVIASDWKVNNNHVAYANVITGNKYEKLIRQFNEQEIDFIRMDSKANLIIFAMINNKKAFLRLVADNLLLFKNLNRGSILFKETFYKDLININTLNSKNINDISLIKFTSFINWSDFEGYNWTFNEFKILYNKSSNTINLYTKLKYKRVDDKVIVIRELGDSDLEDFITELSEQNIDILANKLSICTLSKWKKCLNIINITKVDILKYLIISNFNKFITGEIRSVEDIRFLYRNLDNLDLQESINLASLKEQYISIDASCQWLFKVLNLSNEFFSNYKVTIQEFCVNDYCNVVQTFYNSLCYESDRENLLLIAKAEMSGRLNELKYRFLETEIDYDISEELKESWIKDSSFNTEFKLKEYWDFYSTIFMGELTGHTCFSYQNGSHNDCLLSNFDSNKKLLYAKKDNKIVGRAIIRLTKGSFNKINRVNKLSFLDVESETDPDKTSDEELILFLERPYFKYIDESKKNLLLRNLVEAAISKATKLGIRLVISNAYEEILQNDANYYKSKYYIYISKSKNGHQYIDSLTGHISSQMGGLYKMSYVYLSIN